MKIVSVTFVVCGTLFAIHGTKADQKQVSPPDKLWVASEKDIATDWTDGGWKHWEIDFEPNHTLNAYHGDYAGLGPYVSTWKLVNNHVIIDDSPALRKQGFGTDYGYDFLVMNVKKHIVLMPMKNLSLVQKYGLAAPLCLWRLTKSGWDNLVDKTIDNRKVIEQLVRDQSKQK